MERIDSHQHFWSYDPALHSWMTDDMTVLQRDYGPAELLRLLQQSGLDGSVAVQASQTEAENDFLLSLAADHPFIAGIVGWVDLQSPAVGERLAYYKQFSAIKGFRHVIHDEPDIDFMLRPAFLNGIRTLADFGYTYDILIFDIHLPNTLLFVQQFPDQPFVVDHIAKPKIRNGEIDNWRASLAAVASFPNVCCKISGMVTEAVWKKWKQQDLIPYLDAVVELFGTKRIMYGSDWPVCTLSGSYAETYGIVQAYFSRFSADEQRDFFGQNAKRFYGL
jgi:L-fuconolactonase